MLTYEELEVKIKSMTSKEIIMAMIESLKEPILPVKMNVFSNWSKGVCFGCAATNMICMLGELDPMEAVSMDNIRYGNNSFLAQFENCIDLLRQGYIIAYNDIANYIGVAEIENDIFIMDLTFEPMTTYNYHYQAITKQFINLANAQ